MSMTMRGTLETLTITAALSLLVGCASKALTDDENAGGSSAGGSKNTGGTTSSGCSSVLRQSLSLVDQASTAPVSVLDQSGSELTLYIDASVGGVAGQETHPWVYVKLATGAAVAETDLTAFTSKAWDLAFKRSVIRTNSGDSGPGNGGAIRIALPWDAVDRSTLGDKSLPVELWFEAECKIKLDATNNLITTFSDWSEYNQTSHVLSPAPDVVYITAGADGTLYKVAVLDYYSKPNGAHGIETGVNSDSGRYKLRVAPLP
jgi:hypothetical protein